MKVNKINLLKNKLESFRMTLRLAYFRMHGMQIGKKSLIGKVECEWPNKVRVGAHCTIENNVVLKITKPFQSENYIDIGNNVFIGNACQINCNTKVIISDNCLIASNTTFVDTGHEINGENLIREQPLTVGEIIIQEDVWIGTKCTILKGVTIGTGSVIGAGSVVNKSIPPYQIWAGVPAKYIKNRM